MVCVKLSVRKKRHAGGQWRPVASNSLRDSNKFEGERRWSRFQNRYSCIERRLNFRISLLVLWLGNGGAAIRDRLCRFPAADAMGMGLARHATGFGLGESFDSNLFRSTGQRDVGSGLDLVAMET